VVAASQAGLEADAFRPPRSLSGTRSKCRQEGEKEKWWCGIEVDINYTVGEVLTPGAGPSGHTPDRAGCLLKCNDA